MPYFHDDIDINSEPREQYYKDLITLKSLKKQADIDLRHTNSVTSLGAQFAGLREIRTIENLTNSLFALLDNPDNDMSRYEMSIVELQLLFGLRISEALSIRHNHIMFDGSIFVPGQKGSSDRVVYPVRFRDFWISVKNKQYVPPPSYNRFHFYRLYRKKGIYLALKGNKKGSATHLMRYLYIAKILNETKDIDQVRQLIGHRSIKSTLHYVNKLRKG